MWRTRLSAGEVGTTVIRIGDEVAVAAVRMPGDGPGHRTVLSIQAPQALPVVLTENVADPAVCEHRPAVKSWQDRYQIGLDVVVYLRRSLRRHSRVMDFQVLVVCPSHMAIEKVRNASPALAEPPGRPMPPPIPRPQVTPLAVLPPSPERARALLSLRRAS